MEKKKTSEELAQDALTLLDQAEKLEQERNFSKAIESYSIAAEYLKRSGYLSHRIEDIYSRITELNNNLKQEKLYSQASTQAQLDQVQDQAFAILDGAKRLETSRQYEVAIQEYMSAISLLAQAGWSESQLEGVKSKITSLAQNLERQKMLQQQASSTESAGDSYAQPELQAPEMPVGAFKDQKVDARKAYEIKRRQEADIQNQAFSCIDNAKMFEKEKKFDEAIENYQQAMQLLNSLGWVQQTENLQAVVEKLRRDKNAFESARQRQIQQTAIEETSAPSVSEALPEAESRKLKLLEFEDKKKREEQIQSQAFTLIDNGKRLEREKNYEAAINEFEQAIALFKSIEWDAYIQPIIVFIKEIKEKQQKESYAEQLKRKREEELTNLQKTIQQGQKEQFMQSAQELELKRREFEAQKMQEAEREKEFFTLLNNADKYLQEIKYENALTEYQKALDTLQALGSGWESYIPTIQTTIASIRQQVQLQSTKESEIQRKEQERLEKEMEFQTQLEEKMKEERERLQQKTIAIKERDEIIKQREQRKEVAFKFLDTAQGYIKQKDYDKAIYAYQNSANIFAEIQWTEELPMIENSIKELERKKVEDKELQEAKMQETIKKKEEEKEFQKQIARQSQAEREKIKQKEIGLREKEKELEYREQRKNEAFKLLEEAQKYFNQNEFDKAIEIYHNTAKFFAEIQWQEEIDLIQKSIIEIENKKKEKELRTQKELQIALEREKQQREFEDIVLTEMQAKKDKLKQKEVAIREQQKEIEFREKRKEEAFTILDQAKKLLSQGKFEDSLNLYHNVMNIFAEIQWTEEIPLIQETINQIEEKKREKDLWKQKTMQETMIKETGEIAFLEQIKRQRDSEQSKMVEKQKTQEVQKVLTAQAVAKREEAFKLIEVGDKFLKQNKFEETIESYQKAIVLLKEIGWEAGYLKVIEDSLLQIQNRKIEKEREKQKENDLILKRQLEEQEFDATISDHFEKEKERLKVKKIEIEKRNEIMRQMESRKQEAFRLIENAQEYMSQAKFDEALGLYRNVFEIFTQIQWTEELPLIQNAILEIENKKKEKEAWILKKKQDAKQKEIEQLTFIEEVRKNREEEQAKSLQKQELTAKQQQINAQIVAQRDRAFNLISEGENSLKKNDFDKAIVEYQDAIIALKEIGWEEGYLKLLGETLAMVQSKKGEKIKEIQFEQELVQKRQQEDQVFHARIAEDIDKNKERMKVKKIEIQKREAMAQFSNRRKDEAFRLMEEGERSLRNREFEKSIENYRQAELILSEIQFPTEPVKEMILKVQQKKLEEEQNKQKLAEEQLKKKQEEMLFKEEMADRMSLQEQKMKEKQVQVQKQEEARTYLEKRKDHAFNLLEEAEAIMKRGQYDKSLDYYRSAELILSELQFPTDSIKEMTIKVQEKKREQDLLKQRELEVRIQKEKQDREFQEQIADNITKEKGRMKLKEIQVQKTDQLKELLEQRRVEAFGILDEAEASVKRYNYETALDKYRQAELILNELQFPTDSLREMIVRVSSLKAQAESVKEMELKHNLEKIDEEKQLESLVEERQGQERENKLAQQMAVREREKLVEKQTSAREAAYALLDEAGKHLKSMTPDYDKSISLYVQARNMLAENVGWEPEINHLNELIRDLQQEKASYLERKKLEEEARLRQQEEYEIFQEEINKRKAEVETQKQEQRMKFRELEEQKALYDQIQKEGLALIDQSKKWAGYHEFKKAYQTLSEAKQKFKQIGWTEEIRYIETEFNNIEKMESQYKHESIEMERIQQELDKHRKIEDERRKQEEKKIQATVVEVGGLAGDVANLIREKKKELMSLSQQKKEQIKREAKEYSSVMGKMIQLKKDIKTEIDKKETDKKKKIETEQKSKDREKLDDISKMIKDAAAKKKKK